MDKPFLSFERQIDKLIYEYKLTVNDRAFAYEVLTSLSYYDLVNGYQSIYRRGDEYDAGTTIEQLVTTHIFNKNIQGVLMKYSTYAENSFKNILANAIAERYTEDQNNYLQISNYERKRNLSKRIKLKKLTDKLIDLCKSCTDTPTLHYIQHKDHIPPWILFRNVSFSDTTDLFSFLRRSDKEYILSFFKILDNPMVDYSKKVELFADALKLVRKFRNKIAHNLDFMTYRKCSLNKSANILFNDTLTFNDSSDLVRCDVWGMVLSIVILLNNRYMIHNFLAELNSFLQIGGSITPIYCKYTGIPNDYEDRIQRYISLLGVLNESVENKTE